MKTVLSLDLELRWGMHQIAPKFPSAKDLVFERTRFEVIPHMIELFENQSIKSTWAAVGALSLDGWDEFDETLRFLGSDESIYRINNPYLSLAKELDPTGRVHFSPEILLTLHEAFHCELACHSFNHTIYDDSEKSHRHIFKLDLGLCRYVFNKKFNVYPSSFVYPQNEIAYPEELNNFDIKIYRRKSEGFLSRNRPPLYARGLRFLNAFIPTGIPKSTFRKESTSESAFVRFDLSDRLWGAHFSKLRRSLIVSSKEGKSDHNYHFWWHPHNLAVNKNRNVKHLIEFLDFLCQIPSNEFQTMSDISVQGFPS